MVYIWLFLLHWNTYGMDLVIINFISTKLGPHAEMVEATQSDQNYHFCFGSVINIYIYTNTGPSKCMMTKVSWPERLL